MQSTSDEQMKFHFLIKKEDPVRHLPDSGDPSPKSFPSLRSFPWIFVHRQRSDADVMFRPRSLERGDRFAPLLQSEKETAEKETKNLSRVLTLVWSDKWPFKGQHETWTRRVLVCVCVCDHHRLLIPSGGVRLVGPLIRHPPSQPRFLFLLLVPSRVFNRITKLFIYGRITSSDVIISTSPNFPE